ncbi:LppP/LprE family lipoprotein [Mycobacterium sp.]|uniref:LppP/LprE family lipoprotein n=1 Tax=Mycobacterium sp. TaxID=1785 RepID=UPI003A8A4291
MMGRWLAVLVLVAGLATVGCSSKSSTPAPAKRASCEQTDGPSDATVRRAIASVPVVVPGARTVEIARGHTRNCRLYWVQVIPTIASESTPQQVLFFDRNTPLGPATPQPRPYVAVLPAGQDTVTIQYRWRRGNDKECCPSGSGTVKFEIGPDGKLKALGPIPSG